jgi:hypothetical protein
LPFFWAKNSYSEKTFLGAFSHLGKFIFLKSTQKGGHFDTHIDLFHEKNVCPI